MSERLSDTNAEIQRVFLWQDIVSAFRVHADKVGLKAPCLDATDRNSKPTRLVLAEQLHEQNLTIELWAAVTSGDLVGKAHIFYRTPTDKELYSYEITPDGIAQYSPEPSALDDVDLQDMRADLDDAEWDTERSTYLADRYIFFE